MKLVNSYTILKSSAELLRSRLLHCNFAGGNIFTATPCASPKLATIDKRFAIPPRDRRDDGRMIHQITLSIAWTSPIFSIIATSLSMTKRHQVTQSSKSYQSNHRVILYSPKTTKNKRSSVC